MPGHASREILILFGSLTSCDPGDILETVQVMQLVIYQIKNYRTGTIYIVKYKQLAK